MKALYRADIPSVEHTGGGSGPGDAWDGLDLFRKELAAESSGAGGASAGTFVETDDADQRVLAVCRNLRGHRFLDLRLSVERMTQTETPDWPLTGPRSTK